MFAIVCILGVLAPGPFGADVSYASNETTIAIRAFNSALGPPHVRPVSVETVGVTANVVGVPVNVPGTPANIIVATGHGKPPKRLQGARARMMARRAAEVVAVRNLARKLNLGHPARIRGFRYTHTAYHVDGSVTVTVEYRRR